MSAACPGRPRIATPLFIEDALNFNLKRFIDQLTATGGKIPVLNDWNLFFQCGLFSQLIISNHDEFGQTIVLGFQRRFMTRSGWGYAPRQYFPLHITRRPCGAARAWILCSGGVGGQPCGRMVADIYVPRGELRLCCRTCSALVYERQYRKPSTVTATMTDQELLDCFGSTLHGIVRDENPPDEGYALFREIRRRGLLPGHDEQLRAQFEEAMAVTAPDLDAFSNSVEAQKRILNHLRLIGDAFRTTGSQASLALFSDSLPINLNEEPQDDGISELQAILEYELEGLRPEVEASLSFNHIRVVVETTLAAHSARTGFSRS